MVVSPCELCFYYTRTLGQKSMHICRTRRPSELHVTGCSPSTTAMSVFAAAPPPSAPPTGPEVGWSLVGSPVSPTWYLSCMHVYTRTHTHAHTHTHTLHYTHTHNTHTTHTNTATQARTTVLHTQAHTQACVSMHTHADKKQAPNRPVQHLHIYIKMDSPKNYNKIKLDPLINIHC